MKMAPFFLLSVLVHIAISAIFLWLATFNVSKEASVEFIEIAYYDPSSVRTFVPDMTTVDETEQSESKKSSLVSKRRVRVKNQMQSFDLGADQNRNLTGKRSMKPNDRRIKSGRDRLVKMIKEELNSPMKVAQKGQNSALSHMGPSTFSTRIPGVQRGQLTLLNTEASDIKFYSFFARTHPQVRSHWEGFVEKAVEQDLEVRGESRNWKSWSTIVEIVLDEKGNYLRSFVHRKSGLEPFDIAAVEGLEATTFMNPPAELLDEDGLVRLYYHLTVEGPTALAERRKL